MSNLSNIQNGNNFNNLDGLAVINVDELFIGGNAVDLATLVPYKGANQMLDMGSQNIQTTYYASADQDVVNNKVLSDAVAFITGGVSNSYLNKIIASSQTVAGKVEYQDVQTFDLQTILQNGMKLNAPTSGNWVISVEYIDAYTQNLVFTSSGGAVFKITGDYGWLKSTGWSPQRVMITDSGGNLVSSSTTITALSYLDATSSIQNQLSSKLANTSGQAFGTFDFTSPIPILFSSFGGSKVLITNASKQLAESTVSTTTLSYLDATSSIQTQLNGKANSADLANYLPLAGGTMTGAINMGSSSVTDGLYVFAQPTNADYVQRWRSAINHYSGTLSNTYLFNGPAGTILISQNTTRSATNANLYLGQDLLGSCSVASVKSDGSAGFLPLYLTGTPIILTGNVGVGTSTTNAPLQFSNDLVNRKLVLYDAVNNNHQYYGFGINANTLRYQVSDTGDNHVFFTGTSATTSTELMRIQGNGNVGIGTAPSRKLDVAGDIRSSGTVVATAVNTSQYQRTEDYRGGMSPSQQAGASMGFYFGPGSTGSYSDMLCLNSWTDASGGSVNAIAFQKNLKGIRQYQGTYGSASIFSTYYDCVMTNANSKDVTINDGTLNVYSATANSNGGSNFFVSNQGSGGSYAVMYLSSLGANCYWFLNSQDRSADGGARTATIRNDNGALRLQSSGGNRGVYISDDGLVSVGNATGNSSGILNIWNRNGSITHFNWTDGWNYVRGERTWFDTFVTIQQATRINAELTVTGKVGAGATTVRMKAAVAGTISGNVQATPAWPDGHNALLISPDTVNGPNVPGLSLAYGSNNIQVGVITCLQPSVAWRELQLFAQRTAVYYQGGLASYCDAAGWINVSDEREKEDIQDIKTSSSLRRVLALKPKHYRRKFNEIAAPVDDEIKHRRHIGFCAQEVKENNPHCISEWEKHDAEEDDKIRLGICYNDYIVHLVGAVQEQQKQIEILQERNLLLEQHARQLEQTFAEHKQITETRFEKLTALLLSIK